MTFGEHIQSADWKKEKHIPVIELPEVIEAGKPFLVTVSVGKEIPHPNTVEHHIKWIDVYFKPEGEKFLHQVAHFDFAAHAESVKGANEGAVLANPLATFSMTVKEPGTLVALELCNIHGVWESTAEIALA
ncbi:MAG: class II SORL domain-containing protein [Anaerolineae bacterium]|nr:class II SORL domain-containing protein [Anaerolineae bacterium]